MGVASSLTALFVSAFLLITGNGLMNTLVPLRGKLDGFPDGAIGLIGASYFAGMLLGTFASPLVIKQVGYIRAFLGFVAVALFTALAFPAFANPLAWMLLRGIVGFAFAGLYAVIEGWLSARSEDRNRGRVYAVYQIMTYAGSAAGQQLLGLAPVHGAVLFVTSGIFYVLALLPLAVSRAETPRSPREVRFRLVWFSKASPIGAVAALAVGAANGSFYALAPVYGLGLGLSTGQIATFMTVVTLGTAVSIYPVAFLSDAYDRRLVILIFSTLGAAAELLLARLGSGAGYPLWGAAIAVGATSLVIYTLAFAHANDRTEAEHHVVVSSAMLFLYCVGAVVAPIGASLLMGVLGVKVLFVQNAAIHAALACFVVWRMLRRPPAPRLSGSTEPQGEPAGAPLRATR